MRLSRNPAVFLLMLVLVLSAPIFAQSKSTRGELSVSGKKIPLHHAVALEDDEKLTVLISDAALPADLQKDGKARLNAGLEGKWQGLELRIYRDESVTPDMDVFHRLLKGSAWIGGPDFQITSRTEQEVEGRIYMESPGEFFGKSFHYDVSFRAPIYR